MSAEKEASAKQTFTFQAMARYNASRSDCKTAYHERRKSSGLKGHLIFKPWLGIMHHEVMARQRKLAWILRQQNHYTMSAENQAA